VTVEFSARPGAEPRCQRLRAQGGTTSGMVGRLRRAQDSNSAPAAGMAVDGAAPAAMSYVRRHRAARLGHGWVGKRRERGLHDRRGGGWLPSGTTASAARQPPRRSRERSECPPDRWPLCLPDLHRSYASIPSVDVAHVRVELDAGEDPQDGSAGGPDEEPVAVGPDQCTHHPQAGGAEMGDRDRLARRIPRRRVHGSGADPGRCPPTALTSPAGCSMLCHVVADVAYHGRCPRDLPAMVTWTTRLAPQRGVVSPGAGSHRQARPATAEGRPDRHPCPGRSHRRLVTFFDIRQTLGVGQGRNRTWAFGMYVYTIVVLWYTIHGHRAGIVTTAATTHLVSVEDRPVVRRHAHRATTHPSSPPDLWAPAQPNPPTQKSARSSKHRHSQPHEPRKSSPPWRYSC
jgi:hypothetical protein